MIFREWLLMEDMRDLARAYSDALKDVPQNIDHHPEGSVLNHVKLVRKSIVAAADELQRLKSNPELREVLADMDFRLDSEDAKVLNLAAWLHDIGKASATTVDGIFHGHAKGTPGKVQAIGHERPEHFEPQIERLMGFAPDSLASFYSSHRDLLHFLIERHMDFAQGGFGKDFVTTFFSDGRANNDRRLKLLLVLMWADKMGRGKLPNLTDNISKLKKASKKSRSIHAAAERASKPFSGTEEDFRVVLKARGLDDASIDAAAAAKFGRVQS
jgi:hypothetical protein